MTSMPGPYNPFQPQRQGPAGGWRQSEPLSYSPTTPVTTFFNAVYAWMSAGLGLTAVVAWYVSTQPQLMARIFHGPTLILLFVAELALVFTVSAAVNKINAEVATGLFLLYAALNGLTLSAIFIAYSMTSIAGAFVASAATFGVMSVYGMVTKRDLTQYRSLLMMGLIGVVIGSVVTWFIHSTILVIALNYLGVFVFIGLTAYHTQMLRYMANQTAGTPGMAARYAVVGALTLYLDFINLFLMLLRLLGDRRR